MTADAETMREAIAWLRAEHGGFEPYMLSHGFTAGEVDARCAASLVEPEADMLIDGTLRGEFGDVGAAAAANEAAGYAGLWTGETMHDPFLQLLQAAEATERVTLGTSIAIAFGRTPMTLANTAFDLARYSRGPLRARPRFAGEAAHRAPLLDAVVAPGGAHARVRERAACDLGELAGRRPSSTSRASSTRTR